MNNERLSVEMLHELLICDSEAGRLWWRERTPDMFEDGQQSAKHRCARWNSRWAGEEAFTSVNNNGYLIGHIFGKMYYAHRVIWAMKKGRWPIEDIDHDNHNRADNKWGNLFEATHHENLKNGSASVNNTSGVNGVSWYSKTGQWRAAIGVNGVDKHLGYFDDIYDAVSARMAANKKYGYHENHGKVDV